MNQVGTAHTLFNTSPCEVLFDDDKKSHGGDDDDDFLVSPLFGTVPSLLQYSSRRGQGRSPPGPVRRCSGGRLIYTSAKEEQRRAGRAAVGGGRWCRAGRAEQNRAER